MMCQRKNKKTPAASIFLLVLCIALVSTPALAQSFSSEHNGGGLKISSSDSGSSSSSPSSSAHNDWTTGESHASFPSEKVVDNSVNNYPVWGDGGWRPESMIVDTGNGETTTPASVDSTSLYKGDYVVSNSQIYPEVGNP